LPLVSRDLAAPNGLVFSPDEAPDGLNVDERGNVYVSGPGGLWILLPTAVIVARRPSSGNGAHAGVAGELRLSAMPRSIAVSDSSNWRVSPTAAGRGARAHAKTMTSTS
jgi:hypothetical protein